MIVYSRNTKPIYKPRYSTKRKVNISAPEVMHIVFSRYKDTYNIKIILITNINSFYFFPLWLSLV